MSVIASGCWPGCLAGLVCGHCALDIYDQLLAVQLEGIEDARCLVTSNVIVVVRLFENFLKRIDDLFERNKFHPKKLPVLAPSNPTFNYSICILRQPPKFRNMFGKFIPTFVVRCYVKHLVNHVPPFKVTTLRGQTLVVLRVEPSPVAD